MTGEDTPHDGGKQCDFKHLQDTPKKWVKAFIFHVFKSVFVAFYQKHGVQFSVKID